MCIVSETDPSQYDAECSIAVVLPVSLHVSASGKYMTQVLFHDANIQGTLKEENYVALLL